MCSYSPPFPQKVLLAKDGTKSHRTKPASYPLIERLEHKFKPHTSVNSIAERQHKHLNRDKNETLEKPSTRHKPQRNKMSPGENSSAAH